MVEIAAMAGFLIRALTAAAALLGFLSAGSAWAECRDPDPDRLRDPIVENRTPFHLTVENVRSRTGNIVITLYANDPARWLIEEGSLYIYTVPALAPTTEACIILPGPAVYAFTAYHDSNRNRNLDQIAGKLPTEGVGGSRNPCTGLRRPRLDEVRMRVTRADMETSIRLHYPPFISLLLC